MKLPEFTRKVGAAEDKNRVYVEDYVYAYLNGLRERRDILPIRAALYGKSFKDEEKCYYFVYGAACLSDELLYGRKEEQTRQKFFEAYELIGYVTVCREKQLFSKENGGYYIFYESNEAMQGYLLFCSEGKNRQPQPEADKQQQKRADKLGVVQKGKSISFFDGRFFGELLQRIFYGICIVLMAAALTAINDHEKMNGFVELAEKAIMLQEQEN